MKINLDTTVPAGWDTREATVKVCISLCRDLPSLAVSFNIVTSDLSSKIISLRQSFCYSQKDV